MKEEIFRKKSLERVKSPENLDDFIRVSNPGVWLLLVSITVLLIGACVWGIFGRVDSTVEAKIYVENGVNICYVGETDVSAVKAGMTVRFDGYEAVIDGIAEDGDNGYYFIFRSEETIPDGLYDGKVVVAEMRPISFVLN